MYQYDIDILVVSECRWMGSGRMELNSDQDLTEIINKETKAEFYEHHQVTFSKVP